MITLLALLVGFTQFAGARTPGGGTVTMANGDIYIGRVLNEKLTLETGMGELEIPVAHIHSIDIDHGTRHVDVRTHSNEHIYGHLVTEEIRFSRLQDPTLPLSVPDIDNMRLSAPDLLGQPAETQAWLETTSGNRLGVNARFEHLTLQSEAGERRFELSELKYIDTNRHGFEDELLTQVTPLDGPPVQGKAGPDPLLLSSPYRDTIELPWEVLSRLTLTNTEVAMAENVFRHSLRALGEGPEMISLPGGTYLRGDYQGDGDDDEQPLTEIRLKPFAIGRFEVSFDEYELFCRQTPGCHSPDDQAWGRGNRPVINVSWLEARAYTDWLAAGTGQPYRLPSDAEWEYAHRAGATTRFPWGDEPGQARANCEGCGSIWDGDKTAPRGRFEANAFGLYDTAGNVFEWVADCFTNRFSDAPVDGTPVDKPGCGKRVIRGGAWSFPSHEIRSANRWRDFPSRRSDDTGFRLALDLE